MERMWGQASALSLRASLAAWWVASMNIQRLSGLSVKKFGVTLCGECSIPVIPAGELCRLRK